MNEGQEAHEHGWRWCHTYMYTVIAAIPGIGGKTACEGITGILFSGSLALRALVVLEFLFLWFRFVLFACFLVHSSASSSPVKSAVSSSDE